ncbi:MAG: molybdenum cofactor biosynthesis protein MoaE [Gammaproteobacteria bacterium]|nr:molybdenum cofactor biosynthesis protein MoaE [Gammaproteobacteria bacterium]
MKVEIISEAFNPWAVLQTHEQELLARRNKCGAAAVFVGAMRDYNEGDTVQAMFLEHYPGMTDKYLRKISEEASERWELLDTLIVHRVGDMLPGDNIVLVAAWAGHRAPAFDACRFLIEELKSRAPFWKREILEEGTRWVEKNTDG